ncbi:MAG: hypothetical protein QOD26_3822 [Betaproteobacteria bacterium]|jgi:hypothetical protein|nr:hypothetical protein [Betaproteobacteria bacterium]
MSGLGVVSIEEEFKRQRLETWERRKLGLELRQKYEMYFVALAFTLAGLAVQSAKSASLLWISITEIAGWIALATAGLVGLWRVGQMWVVLVGPAEFADPEETQQESEARGAKLIALEFRVRRFANSQLALFCAGLLFLMVARGWTLLG